jgi:protein involved in polysaccharide export with SLBB domain
MKALLSLLACLLAWTGTTTVARAQGETVLQRAENLKITITGVPPNDTSAMALQQFIVSNEGTVRLTYLKQEVKAAGLTPTQLARNIEAAYKAAGIYTSPTVNVARMMGPDTQQVVTVNGNVRRPGQCMWRPGITLNDAIAECGGFDEFANERRVRLMRNGTTREIDMRNISSNQKNNVVLEPRDSIIVPQGRF